MNWFERLVPSRIKTQNKTQQIPDGLWRQCDGCCAVLYVQEIEKLANVCPKCGHHMRISARQRLLAFLDEDSGKELFNNFHPVDKLRFKDSKKYRDRLTQAAKKTGENEALLVFSGHLEEMEVVAAAFEFTFMGGSMGSVVGERFVAAVEYAIEHHCPFICFAASGGARMQEGLISLMQMAKTSAALTRLTKAKLPFVSVLTDPTMGGVSASLAMLGDVNLAEPGATIGFAGRRVIEQTVRETLPEDFQRSEFLLDKGAIDAIVDRRNMREVIARILRILMTHPMPEKTEEETLLQEEVEVRHDVACESENKKEEDSEEVQSPERESE